MDIVTHISPGHAITSTDPPYHLNLDALNFAALDLLVGFTGKVRRYLVTCVVVAHLHRHDLFVFQRDDPQQLMYLDLAGAPSGFSHYIYWRKKQLAKVGLVPQNSTLLFVFDAHYMVFVTAYVTLTPWDLHPCDLTPM